jgi:hypothetical protein
MSAIQPWASTAMSEHPNDFSDNCYRAIRTKIGEGLRTLFVPAEPSPERILNALDALDLLKNVDASETGKKQDDPKENCVPAQDKPER